MTGRWVPPPVASGLAECSRRGFAQGDPHTDPSGDVWELYALAGDAFTFLIGEGQAQREVAVPPGWYITKWPAGRKIPDACCYPDDLDASIAWRRLTGRRAEIRPGVCVAWRDPWGPAARLDPAKTLVPPLAGRIVTAGPQMVTVDTTLGHRLTFDITKVTGAIVAAGPEPGHIPDGWFNIRDDVTGRLYCAGGGVDDTHAVTA